MPHRSIRRPMTRALISSGTRLQGVRRRAESGMTTAEYAVGTIAACAFAGLLILVVKSGPIKAMLAKVISAALGSAL